MGVRALPGKREDSMRAGTTATIFFFTIQFTLLRQDAAVDIDALPCDGCGRG